MHHRYVDANQVTTLRALLAPTGWLERTRAFALGLRKATRSPGGFLLVGTPEEEPWHLTAHLDEESRLSGIPELMPTLVRWQVPEGAPTHLRVGLERLEAARRGETLFVVSPATAESLPRRPALVCAEFHPARFSCSSRTGPACHGRSRS